MLRKTWVWIVLAVLLVLLLVIAGGFAYLYFHGLSGLRNIGTAAPGQVKVACVGDSITYGHGVSNWPANQYPVVLAGMLGEGYHVANFGVSGSTAQDSGDQPYSQTDIYSQSLAYHGDILIFMLGSNDSKPENWAGAARFQEEYLALLDSYLAGSQEPVVYLCTPSTAYFRNGETTGVTNFDIQPEIVEEIAGIVEQIAAERGYELIDIHKLTGAHPEWFTADGVHPNQDGAAEIAQAVYEAITLQ